MDQGAIARRADRPTQPEATHDTDTHRQPDNTTDDSHTQFIGLHLSQRHRSGLHQMHMHLLPLPARAPLPVGDGALVQSKSGDNRLHRTAEGEQRDDGDDERVRLVQAVERGIFRRAEGRAAAFAPIPLLLLTVDDDRSCVRSPIDPTLGIVADLFLRVHVAPPADVKHQQDCRRTRFLSTPTPSTVHWGTTLGVNRGGSFLAMLNDVEGFTELRERNPPQWSVPVDEPLAYQGLCKSCY